MSEALNKTLTKSEVTYNSLHWWIRRTLGSATKCQNIMCVKESTLFEWALMEGREYVKDPKNFIQLCRKCHFNYDLTASHKTAFDIGRVNAQKARIGTHHTSEAKRKISENRKGTPAWNKGKEWSAETRKKMSEAAMGRIPWNKGLKKI